MDLTQRQRIAIQHACLRAKDAAHPRFSQRGTSFVTFLTVNK